MLRRHTYLIVVILLAVTVLPFLMGEGGIIDVSKLSTYDKNGWWTIITGSFMHGTYSHLIGNLPLLMLGAVLVWNLYKKYFWLVVSGGILAPSFVSYSIGMNSVGISGLVFALLWFLIFRGLMSRDRLRFFVAIGLLVMYGYTLKGVIPPKVPSNINWIAHLAGLGVGFCSSFIMRMGEKR